MTIKRDKEKEGILKKDKLNPGDLIFTDQYESSLGGRIFSQRGFNLSSQEFKGGTIFCDAASSRIFITNQVTLSSQETIEAKLNFERDALSAGVEVKSYNSDNGIYTSKEFMKELVKKGQGLKLSGVGAHHHNGVAENAIKIVVTTARTIMIHAAIRWPEYSEKNL